jgi:hypothetical protein
MIRLGPAQINRVALAVEPDEAFNPVALGVPGPDAFVRRISDVGQKSTGIGWVIANVLGVFLGPIF